RALLEAAVPGGLDEQVLERLVAETRGNPLALQELPRGLTPAELAGGFGLLDAQALSGRIEHSFARRVQSLPPETQRLLLIAAAEAVGDGAVVARAADQLAIDIDAVNAAEDAGLIEFGPGVRFRHPLVRTASYRAATPHERRQVHEALAAAIDSERDPDRRAWHRVHAAAGPDEGVAAELERSASRACAPGGRAAGAAFLEQAAQLTPGAAQRGARALAAAQLKFDAGAYNAAEHLLAVAATSPLEEVDHARAERLRALIAFARSGGGDSALLLSAAAKRLEPFDPELARETHLDALLAAARTGRFLTDEAVVAAAAAAARGARQQAGAIVLMLGAVGARMADGYEPAVPMMARALAAFRAEGFSRENLAWWWLACQLAMDMWDNDGCEEIANGLGRATRER